MKPLREPARPSAARLRNVPLALGLAVGLGFAWLATIAWAQEGVTPVLGRVFPAGGQQGATFDVEAFGSPLVGVDRLHFSNPGITAQFQPAPPPADQAAADAEAAKNGKSEKFRVTIAPTVKPGVYDARVVGADGVSNPRAFVVGTRPELLEVEPNNQPSQATEIVLGTVANGRTEPQADVDYFKFIAEAGQRLILDCSAYRIDSRLDAVLILYNSAGEEIERSHDYFRRDPLIDFSVPASGEYRVAVRDLVYAGSSRNVYRLSIGVAPHLDFVFPPAGLPGSDARYRLFGRNLPGGRPAGGVTIDGKPLETLDVSIPLPADPAIQQIASGWLLEPVEAGVDGIEFHLDSDADPSNSVFVSMATAPVIAEQEPNDDPAHAQAVSLPCEYVGQFYPRGDQDWLTFEAHQGDIYWIEIFAQQLGLPVDPVLLVQQVVKRDTGETTATDLATVDDDAANPAGALFAIAGDDAAYQFTAPADGAYRVMLTDLAGTERSDPRFVYRLSIRPPSPDFRLVAIPRFPPNNTDIPKVPATVWNPTLRRGGADLLEVIALRRDGFNGEIAVNVAGLPAGVTAPAITLGPGQSTGTLILSAAEDAPAGIGEISITGTTRIGEVDVARTGRPAAMVSNGVPISVAPRSRIARDLVIGVIGGQYAPVSLDTGSTTSLEMARPGVVKVPINLVRRGDFKGAATIVALSLPPGATLVGPVTIDPNKSSGEVEIKLGKNTPLGVYSCSVIAVAEVAASIFTPGKGGNIKLGIPAPPLNLTVTSTPIRLKVAGPAGPAHPGSRIELPIAFGRLYGYNEPVQVRLTIPNELSGIRAAIVTVQRGESEGKLAITLTEDATPGVHKLTLNAIAKLGGQELPTTQEIVLTVEPAPPK